MAFLSVWCVSCCLPFSLVISAQPTARRKTLNRILLAAPALAAAAGAALAGRQNKQKIPYSFKGRSVVITGASRGLGFVMARELAREGANLTILARNGAALDKAAQDLRTLGARVLPVTCDVGDREQTETA